MLDLMEWVWPRSRVQAAVETTALSKTIYVCICAVSAKKKDSKRLIADWSLSGYRCRESRVVVRVTPTIV